jgi:NADPH:quinone reductase-like Zn-dependent oxidoreductase
MRVVEASRNGPPEVLRSRTVADPAPSDGSVVLEVRACGVCFPDLMARAGLYPGAPAPPFVPGFEVAGMLEGHRVIAMTEFNGYAERVAVPPERVVALPSNLSLEEGAGLLVNFVTAWVAMAQMARVTRGQRILVESAAGGVGLAAVQIAHHFGAEIYGVTGSALKADFLKRLGVNAILRGQPWPKDLDAILDPTGFGGIKRNLKHLASGGRVVLYGTSELLTSTDPGRLGVLAKHWRRPKIDPLRLMHDSHGIFGFSLLSFWQNKVALKRVIERVLEGVKEGWLRPRLAKVFPLEQAAQAHAYLHDRQNVGKVVLKTASR